MILYATASEAVNPGAGRANAIPSTFNYVNNKGKDYLLFGFGPGHIIGSFLVNEKRSIQDIHNLPYGNRSGFVWLFLQIGILGALAYFLFILNILCSTTKIYKEYKNKRENASILLGIIGAVFLLIFDFSFYSVSFITNGVTMPVLLYLLAIYVSPIRARR